MKKFTKIPVQIEAVRVEDALAYAGNSWSGLPAWLAAAYERGDVVFDKDSVRIQTLEGVMTADRDDWIIRGVKGELYPCKPDIFALTYQEVAGAEGAVVSLPPDDIEAEIIAKGKTAPRVTPADIEGNIVSEWCFTAAEGVAGREVAPFHPAPQPLHLLTFCVLVMRNGFTVTGESACASPENFDFETGRKIARQNAVAKIWPLMGYQLRERLAQSR